VQDLLEAEKHDEFTMRNHHQHPVGTAPLPEVNYNSKGKEKEDESKPSKNVGKFKKDKRNKHKKDTSQRSKFRERKGIIQVSPLWWS
jgi:hypothetical protein